MGPLEGITVLDFSRVLAGPFCTMILGDLGATVIKVERPGTGDDSRQFGPYINSESAYFMSVNRNKYSITLDLKSSKGVDIVKELVKKVDIVVENFKPGTMKKFGIEYETLSSINPALIFASASGFGQTGPYSAKPAYDSVIQAMGGLMSITGAEDGEPTRVGSSISDITAGLFTVIGILSALHFRGKTGKGQLVDVAMLDTQVAILENAIARFAVTGVSPKPIGNRHPSIVPFEPFDTKEQKLVVAIGNDKLWEKFCELIDLSDLAYDNRFRTNPLRNKNYDLLRPHIAVAMMRKTAKEWQAIFDKNGIPCGPINTVEDIIHDEHILSREMIVKLNHPVAGETIVPGVPIKLSKSPGDIKRPAPRLGEHNQVIYKKMFGLDDERISQLTKQGIL